MSKGKTHSGIKQDEINKFVENKIKRYIETSDDVETPNGVEITDTNITDASIPSQLLILVTDEYANVRRFPTHIAYQERRVIKGTKLSFDDLVTGEFIVNSDKWYKVEDGYIHESQVKEINEVIFE